MGHHALLLEGSYEWALTRLPEPYQKVTSDIVHRTGTRMGIDEVRSLTYEAHLTPFNGDERVFILAYTDFTHEAQNALLKLLEEPPLTARFYLITNRADELLPTLCSRLMSLDREKPLHGDIDHQDFLRLSYVERLERIASKMQKKDDVWAVSLMNAYEMWAEEMKDVKFMKALLELRPFFLTPGASKKMILEHLALMLPQRVERQ